MKKRTLKSLMMSRIHRWYLLKVVVGCSKIKERRNLVMVFNLHLFMGVRIIEAHGVVIQVSQIIWFSIFFIWFT